MKRLLYTTCCVIMAVVLVSACEKYGFGGAGKKITTAEIVSEKTKAAPVTSENISSAYNVFKTSAYLDGTLYSGDLNTQGSGQMKDISVSYDDADNLWHFSGTYYWPGTSDLTFCSFAPADAVNSYTFTGGKVSFPYSLPDPSGTSDAVSQKDLLCAIDTQNYQTNSDGFVKVNFHHALTAVKFIKGDITGTIETISLNNFCKSGNVSFNGSDHKFTWTGQSTLKSFTQAFGCDASSLASGASLDSDGSRTFMMIPQDLTDRTPHATISIKLAGIDNPVTLDLTGLTKDKLFDGAKDSDVTALKDWSDYAGRSITFKVNRKKIEISIQDENGVTVNVFGTGGSADMTFGK